MKNKWILFTFINVFLIGNAFAIEKNTAKMQAMDKITGMVSVVNVPVGGKIDFGSLSIVVRHCATRPEEETPDNFAFVDVVDKSLKGEELNIFKGWMISSSPATHAVEHPIYDVWLLKCLDTEVDKDKLLSEEELALRDNLPMSSRYKDNDNMLINDESSSNSISMKKSDVVIKEMEVVKPLKGEDTPESIVPEDFEFTEDEEYSVDTF